MLEFTRSSIHDLLEFRGSATIDILEEHTELMAKERCAKKKSRMAVEREVEELTRDTMQIQALVSGGHHVGLLSNILSQIEQVWSKSLALSGPESGG